MSKLPVPKKHNPAFAALLRDIAHHTEVGGLLLAAYERELPGDVYKHSGIVGTASGHITLTITVPANGLVMRQAIKDFELDFLAASSGGAA